MSADFSNTAAKEKRDAPLRAVLITGPSRLVGDSTTESEVKHPSSLYTRIVFLAYAWAFGAPDYLRMPNREGYDILLLRLLEQGIEFLESSVLVADIREEAQIVKNNLWTYLMHCEKVDAVPNVILLTDPKTRFPREFVEHRDKFPQTFICIEHHKDHATIGAISKGLGRIVEYMEKRHAKKHQEALTKTNG